MLMPFPVGCDGGDDGGGAAGVPPPDPDPEPATVMLWEV
jgi:hypothetical protein